MGARKLIVRLFFGTFLGDVENSCFFDAVLGSKKTKKSKLGAPKDSKDSPGSSEGIRLIGGRAIWDPLIYLYIGTCILVYLYTCILVYIFTYIPVYTCITCIPMDLYTYCC